MVAKETQGIAQLVSGRLAALVSANETRPPKSVELCHSTVFQPCKAV